MSPAKKRKLNPTQNATTSPGEGPMPMVSSQLTVSAETLSFFQDRLYNIPAKYGIPEVVLKLFKLHENVALGTSLEDELGRTLRLSPNSRRSLLETINKCIDIMSKTPDEASHCIKTIRKCSLILKHAEQPATTTFPFFQLPLEVREKIYELVFGNCPVLRFVLNNADASRTRKGIVQRSTCPEGSCYFQQPRNTDRLDLAILRTCERVRDEALPILYSRTLSFNCACSMFQCLDGNWRLHENVDSIIFHWQGDDAANGIRLLQECSELRKLTVIISKETTNRTTHRQSLFDRFFPGQNSAATRLTEALGMDELLKIRGLEEVEVESVELRPKKNDMLHLHNLLNEVLKQEKPDDYGEE